MARQRWLFVPHAATTETYALSLHDALPIYRAVGRALDRLVGQRDNFSGNFHLSVSEVVDVTAHDGEALARIIKRECAPSDTMRSEEHTSELQSRRELVCRLLLEKKKEWLTT